MVQLSRVSSGAAALMALMALFHPPAESKLKAAEASSANIMFAFQAIPEAHFQFEGVLGERIRANIDHWLLIAPEANPGMLEMFRMRDRQPAPNLVPWAGEFVGKYLISAIQTLRLSQRPELSSTVRHTIKELIAAQDEVGYLGPFPRANRLLGNWDLWGHYHCMMALLMWHEMNGDDASLTSARRIADLVCATFLETPRRILDAGSPEMNMASIHSLGRLYRITGERRYLRMIREIEKDWEKAGDYLRTGLAGKEFYQTPRPRWESLPDLQGLLELYRITGAAKYRQAFEHHWRSIMRWDQRNTGGFSSGEQATGDPYAPTAIETCCTVAWMALCVDMLELAGDPRVADALELAAYNAAAGAQHPSGRWWTYNTPMDGAREASAHTIVFQARAGTPELNCCSVNGPRSLGMLSEWAVMAAPDGLVVNYLGPGSFTVRLPNGTAVSLECHSDYPRTGQIQWRITPAESRKFKLMVRIPAWAGAVSVALNGMGADKAQPGSYLTLDRVWEKGDIVTMDLDLALRFVPGDKEAAGKVSLYRGPLLLAYDQRWNDFDEAEIPAVDLGRLANATTVLHPGTNDCATDRVLSPWIEIQAPCTGGKTLRLCDFASAGAAGTRYCSWLKAEDCPPPRIVTKIPHDGASIPSGLALFRWSGPKAPNPAVGNYRLLIWRSAIPGQPIVDLAGLTNNRLILAEAETRSLTPGVWYEWNVVARNPHGT
ncbi:MAG: glycoside hydrolase family 127 protein, partial [Candidatus Omnitrophica bacterium]|nr:glycoside hydrolase family 127 protein [Candidatus Omnitrophota bacterium]